MDILVRYAPVRRRAPPGKPHADAAQSPPEHYGVKLSLFRPHDALGDAKRFAQIFPAKLLESKRLNEDVRALKQPIFIKRFIVPPL